MREGALWYLTRCRFRNWLRSFRRRATRPRYLVVYLLGVAYVGLVFVGPLHISPASARTSGQAVDILAVLFTLNALRWWLTERDRGPLAFTAAEVTFLFPAPLTRQQLIRFKLARIQVILLISALISSLLARRGGLGTTPGLLRAISFWVCYGTLYLHRLAAALTRATLAERGSVGLGRRAVLIVVTAAAIAIPSLFALQEWPVLSLAWKLGLPTFLRSLGQLIDLPVVAALLWPVRILLRPTVAPDFASWVMAILPAAAFLIVHLVWVTVADHRFEEAAIEASSRRAQRLAGRPEGDGLSIRRGLPLPHRASPAVAVAWKNIQAQLRNFSRPTILALGVPVVGTLVFTVMYPAGSLREVIGWFALFWAAFLVLIGPQWVRYDLRRDLARIDLLRSYPVSGRSIVTGEIAASAAIITTYQFLLLALGVWGIWSLEETGLSPSLLLGGAAGLGLILPVLNWLAVGIQNAGALIYPEWVRRGARAPGIETTGQNVIALLSTGILLGVAGAVPAGAAVTIVLMTSDSLGAWALVAAGIVASAGLLLEARWFAGWLGRRFESYDPSAVRLRAEG